MRISILSYVTLSSILLSEVSAFVPSQLRGVTTTSIDGSIDTALFGVNRRARRNNKQMQEQGKSRPDSFYDTMSEMDDDGKKKKKGKNMGKGKKGTQGQDNGPSSGGGGEGPGISSGSVADADTGDNSRPAVSKIVIDEATGIERIQQGQYVMDVATRKAVQLSDLGPQYRMAQMFPGVPPEIRDEYRVDWNTVEVPQLVETLRKVAYVPVTDEETGETKMTVPENNKPTDQALDFVTANRDLLGPRMSKVLGRLKLRAQSQMDKEGAIEMRKLWKHFMVIDESLTAPFRQMLSDAEGKVGPNFGNLDLKAFCSGELYERTANYLVLKGMVAHWEKKVRDAEYAENTDETRSNFLDVLMVGDPKRYLPEPPVIFRYNEVVRITLMAQNMTSIFVDTPELYDDLPAEVRFVQAASNIKGGTALRQYMVQEFCPAEEITPEALREGLRRLNVALSNMQIDPYGDLKNVVARLCEAVSVGTDDERDPYIPYLYNLDKDGPGSFETYTFNHDRQSLVRFLDSAKEIQQGGIGPTSGLFDQLSNEATNLFGFGQKADQKAEEEKKKAIKKEVYKVPDRRACGRPHNTGWLSLLGDEELGVGMSSGDPDEDVYESDNWREIISQRQRIGVSK
mmetsp:Transcript_8957/g.12851  ORF Transcript_8957/g.12851 Transcript_8957/m.12851 type:complete len:626 (+) Transcript_8957:300-2177(+)